MLDLLCSDKWCSLLGWLETIIPFYLSFTEHFEVIGLTIHDYSRQNRYLIGLKTQTMKPYRMLTISLKQLINSLNRLIQQLFSKFVTLPRDSSDITAAVSTKFHPRSQGGVRIHPACTLLLFYGIHPQYPNQLSLNRYTV